MNFSFLTRLRDRVRSLSTVKRFFFGAFLIIFIFGLLGTLNTLSNHFSVLQPTYGGSVSEGILGTPRFINPVLAVSDVDRDLVKLAYSGLMRSVTNTDNVTEIIPDLAESYTLSNDGKTYTFILRDNAVFHDRTPVTSADVLFTVNTIQDSRFQSPLLNQWSGITTNIIDDRTISFTLSRPFSGFLDTVASLGIIPKHIWGTFTADEFIASTYNTLPIGSGPFRVTNIKRDTKGTASQYTFRSFRKFVSGRPFISKFIVKFYPNEQFLFQDYESGKFDLIANIHPYEINQDNTRYVVTTPLPRMFGLFINTAESEILKDKNIQSILNTVIDRNEIIDNVFQGYAQAITNPLNLDTSSENPNDQEKQNLDLVSNKLETLGWKINTTTGIREKNGKPLRISISTADTAELKYTAQIIQKQLKKSGIDTEIKIFQLSDLETNIIKKKSFEILLFGQLIKNDGDLYAFWHSSQQNTLGLNVTGFTDSKLDSLLETLISTNDTEERKTTLESIKNILTKAPVIWLYQPDMIYALNKKIYGIQQQSVVTKNDRFNSVYRWYTNIDHVWNIFSKK